MGYGRDDRAPGGADVVGLVIVTAGLTVVFLSMRAVMDIGGYCASGGPYVIAQECPRGAAAMMPAGTSMGVCLGLWMYEGMWPNCPVHDSHC